MIVGDDTDCHGGNVETTEISPSLLDILERRAACARGEHDFAAIPRMNFYSGCPHCGVPYYVRT